MTCSRPATRSCSSQAGPLRTRSVPLSTVRWRRPVTRDLVDAFPALPLGLAQANPEPGGLADRFLDRPWLPTQFAGGLAVIHRCLGAHQPHRAEREPLVGAVQPCLDAADQGQR